MYIRFVIKQRDQDSHQFVGIFQPAAKLKRSNEISDYDRERLLGILAWFDGHLDEPERFSKSRRPEACPVAISWYKDTAREHISQMREMASILNDHGYGIDELTTSRPGAIVWEDGVQIVAEPFRDTFK